MKYSNDALIFLGMLTIDKSEFEIWFKNLNICVGTSYIYNYLRDKNYCFSNGFIDLDKISTSEQAKKVIKYLKHFDENNFKKWISNNFIIERQYITDFIVNYKEKQDGK